MSVQEQMPIVVYVANGNTNRFAITFDLHDQNYLVVTLNNEVAQVGSYSVLDGEVVFGTAPADGSLVTLYRDTQLNRTTDYKSYDNSFRPESVNWDFDKLWHVLQEQNLIDGKILARIKDEIEWRRTHDFNYDELAQVREKQLFDALKGYADTLYSATNPNVFAGVIAGVVFARDGKSIQTHIEEILDNLVVSREDIDSKAGQQYVDDQLNLKANSSDVYLKSQTYNKSETYSNTEVDTKFSAYVGGRKAYTTLALAQADQVNLTANTAIEVTNDGENNGTYQWNGTTLTKSDYDPLTQAKNYADVNPLFNPVALTTENIKTITKTGRYTVASKNNVTTSNGYPDDPMAVDAGFLDVNISGSTFAYRVLEWYPRSNGVRFTATYNFSDESWSEWRREVLTQDIAELSDEIAATNSKIDKPYEIITESLNLFDLTTIQADAYIGNAGVLVASAGATGWGVSDFIPVTEGEYYTISGSRGRHGVGFYSSKEQATSSALSYDGTTTLPLTVQAPVGANFMLLNVYSASNPNYSNLQVEKGSVATAYMPYGTDYKINPDYIAGVLSLAKGKLEINGTTAKVFGVIDGKEIIETVSLTKTNTHSQSTVLNFIETKIDGVIHRTMTDDVAPLRADSTTIGANHGYAKNTVTSASHGKTVADIGSVWSDGTYEWVIIDIVSVNQIALTARASNRGSIASNNFTHVSGASNTASFTATANVSGQWYQCFKNRKLSIAVDGIIIDQSKNGSYDFKDSVAFHESYEIMKKSDIVEWLIANKGQDYQYYNADSAILYSQSYTFDKECGCTIYSSIVSLKSVPFVDYMATQAVPFNSGNGNVLYYAPKSTNFSDLVNITSNPPSASVFFDASNLESNANPVDRLIMLNNSAGFAVGYLPVLSASPDVRGDISQYGEIRVSTNKWYPKVAYSSGTTLNAGDHYEVIAYRKPFLRSAERTASYVVRSTHGDYLYLNWHTAKRDVIELPDDLVGREFEIVEKSSNVTLLSAFATNSIVCDVGGELPSGYLTLKFK
ncbi:pyocin knob domain-containing protein [Acinetobacter indicus]|uniref:pyocin knob domain-containing protein n=1 Tax=Acinetobacter indicus TaxID=756892 RepID=UPI00398908AB